MRDFHQKSLVVIKGRSLTFCLCVLEKIPFVFQQEVIHFPALDHILSGFIAGLEAFAPTPLLPQELTVDQSSPFTTHQRTDTHHVVGREVHEDLLQQLWGESRGTCRLTASTMSLNHHEPQSPSSHLGSNRLQPKGH